MENKPRRHPCLEFTKYSDAILETTLEGAEEAKRNGSEGFQGPPSKHCRGELGTVFLFEPRSGRAFSNLGLVSFLTRSWSQVIFICFPSTSCALPPVVPCLQDIASGSMASSHGTSATQKCRFISFRWRCSGLVPSKLSLQMLVSSCAAQCDCKGSQIWHLLSPKAFRLWFTQICTHKGAWSPWMFSKHATQSILIWM